MGQLVGARGDIIIVAQQNPTKAVYTGRIDNSTEQST